jgi:hypothetical protein
LRPQGAFFTHFAREVRHFLLPGGEDSSTRYPPPDDTRAGRQAFVGIAFAGFRRSRDPRAGLARKVDIGTGFGMQREVLANGT